MAAPIFSSAHGPTCTAAVLLLVLWAGGCVGSRNRPIAPDEQYGHRYEGRQEGRITLTATPPDSLRDYFFYPVVVESLQVRHAPFDPALPADGQRVPTEALIYGVLPDDCSELHELQQWRAGHILHLTFEMRRPVGAVCNRIGRPFRFYTRLEGTYAPGDYIIKMDGAVYPFVIRPRLQAES